MRLPKRQILRRVVLTTDTGAPVARATQVRIAVGGGVLRQLPSRPTASGQFPRALRASSMRITVLRWQLRVTSSTATGAPATLPVGISEVKINGVANPA